MSKYFLFLYSLMVLFSCTYEEGPGFSLRSKKARAVNTWYIDKAYENGIDKTDTYKNAFVNYQLELKSDDNYRIFYRAFNVVDYEEKGTWKFSDDKIYLLFKPEGSNNENKVKILRLKHTEARVIMKIDDKDVELHMKD